MHVTITVSQDGTNPTGRPREGRFVFERMSPADVWNLIATAARENLFQLTVQPFKKPRRLHT